MPLDEELLRTAGFRSQAAEEILKKTAADKIKRDADIAEIRAEGIRRAMEAASFAAMDAAKRRNADPVVTAAEVMAAVLVVTENLVSARRSHDDTLPAPGELEGDARAASVLLDSGLRTQINPEVERVASSMGLPLLFRIRSPKHLAPPWPSASTRPKGSIFPFLRRVLWRMR